MVVVDTCVLSSLAKINRLNLLRKAFEKIIATPSVVSEIERVGEAKFVRGIKEVLCFEEVEEEKFIFVVPLSQKELQYAHKLKKRDFYEFSEDDKTELFSYFDR